MTPSYPELTAAIRREGEAIVAAGKLGLEVEVPTCPGWDVADLLRHVGRVYARAARLVGERLTADVAVPDPGDVDPVTYLVDELDELVHALASTEADTPVWNWSPDQPQAAAFWARRMAHESTMHRFDAQRAHNLVQPIGSDLAHDGLDELVDVVLPRVADRGGVELPAATYLFASTGGGSWAVRLGPDGVSRLEVAKEPQVTARGTTSSLLLATQNRMPWSSLETDGDVALLDRWSEALQL